MNISTFVNWTKEKDIASCASVELTPYAGYGLFSTDRIHSDAPTVVVHIPNDMLLTSRNALKVNSSFSQAIFTLISRKYNTDEDIESLAQDPRNERLVLCLFLIYCKFFEPESIWKPYIDILPTLDFFKENHVLFKTECVAGTSLENSIRAKISSLKRELDEINDTEQEEGEEDCKWLSKIQLETYMWADSVFWSRVVGIGGDEDAAKSGASTANMALIPFFDFANHSAGKSNIRWQLNAENQGLDLVTYPNEIVEKGKELCLSYGSKPNQELLFLHGFCIQDNPEPSRVTIPLLPFLNPADSPHNLHKIQWLKQIGAKPSLTLVGKGDDGDNNELTSYGWTFDSMAVMYFVALDEDDGIAFSFDEENNCTDLILSGETVNTLKDLEASVKTFTLFPVTQLRAVMLLLDAVEYHYSLVTGDADRINEEDKSALWKQAEIYRTEEEHTLKSAIDNLSNIRDRLMQDPTVVSFLESPE